MYCAFSAYRDTVSALLRSKSIQQIETYRSDLPGRRRHVGELWYSVSAYWWVAIFTMLGVGGGCRANRHVSVVEKLYLTEQVALTFMYAEE